MDRPWQKIYEQGVPADIAYPEGMVVPDILDRAAALLSYRPVGRYAQATMPSTRIRLDCNLTSRLPVFAMQ